MNFGLLDFGYFQRVPPISYGKVNFVGYCHPIDPSGFKPGRTHVTFMGPGATPQWVREYAEKYKEREVMNDKDILLRLLQQAYADDAISQAAKQEFEKLVTRFDEEGADLEISVNHDLDETQEIALRNLREEGYTTQSLRYHGPGEGHVLHVGLRAKKFLEMANDKRSVVLGMNDSGQRQTFDSGAVRDTAEGKPRPDLFSPFAMERIGSWLEAGARKYSEHNWSKGIPASRCLASLHRHLMKYMQGATDEDHLSAVATNCMFLLHFEEAVKRGFLPETLMDLPDYSVIPRVHQNGDARIDYEPDEEFRPQTFHDNS